MKQLPESHVGPGGEEENIFRQQEEKKMLRAIAQAETGKSKVSLAQEEVARIQKTPKDL